MHGGMSDSDRIRSRFELLAPFLNERTRRLVAGAEAASVGHGGISAVAAATGVSRRAVSAGIRELKSPQALKPGRIRKEGAGRKKATETDPTLFTDLEVLIEPVTCGHPESPLKWTSKSVRKLAAQLNKMGHKTNRTTVSELLNEMGYSLQANKKTVEGSSHADRDSQFEHINSKAQEYLNDDQPVISVDTKKKELVGNFKNSGRELRPRGKPEQVLVHDFMIPGLGKANPYGVYDVNLNEGWVSVGVDHDTSAFAVQTIRRWWHSMGRAEYPKASRLLVTADCGGSNGYRGRLWKIELQKLADETALEISVCHLPPGTSKWNRIEHRMFSFITQNWRGKPLISHEVIVKLIASTRTEKGLSIRCELDTNNYPKGIKVSDKEMKQINLIRHSFHGEWNYTIRPRSP